MELRYTELRQAGRSIYGTAVVYNEVATGAPSPERFLPGAFQPLPTDLPLTIQHERSRIIARQGGAGGLQLIDTEKSLEVRATLPQTREGEDAHLMVRSGLLRGLSIEFYSISERQEQGIRVLDKARLTAISAVDDPAFSGSEIEARQLRGSFLRARVPWNTRLGCGCVKGACRKVRFSEDVFDQTLDNPNNEVLAIVGDFKGAVASRRRGSLVLTKTKNGLEIDLKDTANSDVARDLAEQAKTV